MKKLFVGLVLAVACLAPLVCQAQYYYYPGYGYYYFNPQSAGRPGYGPSPAGQAAAPPTTMYQRWMPDPRMIRRWEQQNRITDYFEPQRSPLNRESDLDYMLRTF